MDTEDESRGADQGEAQDTQDKQTRERNEYMDAPLGPIDFPEKKRGLLQCPFCGGRQYNDHGDQVSHSWPKLEETVDSAGEWDGWRVVCYGCGVQTWNGKHATRAAAIAHWNTRRSVEYFPAESAFGSPDPSGQKVPHQLAEDYRRVCERLALLAQEKTP